MGQNYGAATLKWAKIVLAAEEADASLESQRIIVGTVMGNYRRVYVGESLILYQLNSLLRHIMFRSLCCHSVLVRKVGFILTSHVDK